jgi:hypothetical protein
MDPDGAEHRQLFVFELNGCHRVTKPQTCRGELLGRCAFYAGCAGAPKRDPAINTPCTFAKPQTQNPKPKTINPSALQYVGKGPAQRALRICRSLELFSATSIANNIPCAFAKPKTLNPKPKTINPSALQYVSKGSVQRALRICRSLELFSATSIVQNTILIWARFDTMHDQIMLVRI